MISFDYLIVGGGPVGLSAAIAVKQRGFSVAVVDKHPLDIEPTNPGRAYAINQLSQHLLTSLKVWPRLSKDKLSPYEKMFVWDPKGQAEISFDCRERGTSALGFIVEEHLLKEALCEEYALNPLPPLEAKTLIEHDDHIILKTNDDQGNEHLLRAGIVFITDGASSSLRQQLKVPLTHWPYHHHATVATIRTEKTHQKTAYQIFTHEGPLAFLPLADPHLCSIVWSATPSFAKHLSTLSNDAFNEALAATFEKKLGACELVSNRRQFPLHMRHVEQYHGKRWILMGDAAHTIHPLAGLGLNLGLADLNTWLELTEKTPISPSILGAYQRKRKSETWAAISLMELLKTTFTQSTGPLPWLRGLGMNVINQMTPLKRLMMNYACGTIPHTKSGTTPP